MKNKFIAILTFCMVLFLSFSAFACAETPSDKDHAHNFYCRIITEEFLASKATCTEKARYFYSCDCGEKDIETFEHGALGDHNYGDWISNGNDTHTKTCANDSSHTITESCSGGTATDTTKAICDVCNAEHGESLIKFSLTNNNTEYKITDYKGCSSEINIPATYNGKPVTSIGNMAFYDCDSLTSIIIPNSVTSIGDWTFEDCSSLTSITIPDSVTFIGDYAFYNCSSLTSIKIPDGVTNIGDSTFRNCDSLTSITIPNSVTSIGFRAFSSCYSLETIYCEAESQPSGWDSDWKYGYYAEVVWNYKNN